MSKYHKEDLDNIPDCECVLNTVDYGACSKYVTESIDSPGSIGVVYCRKCNKELGTLLLNY